MRRYLLILSCSQRKRKDSGFLPAIERYDGVNFRVIKKLGREGGLPKNLDILIISAKYGILTIDQEIGYYSRRMTRQRALELQPLVLRNVKHHLHDKEYDEIFVNLGKSYLPAIEGFESSLTSETKVIFAKGGIGNKMAQMKAWLSQG